MTDNGTGHNKYCPEHDNVELLHYLGFINTNNFDIYHCEFGLELYKVDEETLVRLEESELEKITHLIDDNGNFLDIDDLVEDTD